MEVERLALAIAPLYPLFFALLSILVGALIALIAIRKATHELKDEAESLRRLLKLTLRALEANGLANVAYNASGEPVEIFLVTKEGSAEGRSPDFLDSLEMMAPRRGSGSRAGRH
jgi:hypothetical protein